LDRGVVLEIRGDRAIVLVRGGEFRRVRLGGRNLCVGQEIEVPALPSHGFWPVFARPRLVAVVALALIVALLPAGYFEFWAPRPALASVCVDINPTVELGIDIRGTVVEARGVGADGQTLLDGVEWKGRQVDELIAELVKLSAVKGFVQKDSDLHLLVTVIPAEGKEIPPGLEKKILGLQTAVEARLVASSVKAPVTVLRGDGDLRKVAQELGISPGKVAVMLEAREGGLDITAEEIREERITRAIPRAGGRLPEILKKAEERKSWTKLLEKYQDETSRSRGKKGQSLEPAPGKAVPPLTAGPPAGKGPADVNVGVGGKAPRPDVPAVSQGRAPSDVKPADRWQGQEPAPERQGPGEQKPEREAPEDAERHGSPVDAKEVVIRRNGSAIQWYAERLSRSKASARPRRMQRGPGPKGDAGSTGP
jgi:hypothetical protein